MLGNFDVLAIVAVTDPDRARRFYSDVLGLERIGDDEVLAVYRAGNSRLVVYPSQNAGTNKANAVAWPLAEAFDDVMAALEAKNVNFVAVPEAEHMNKTGNVYSAGPFKFAWFTDPDGNVLHINSMPRSE